MSKQIIILLAIFIAALVAKYTAISPLAQSTVGSWENAIHVSCFVLAFLWYAFEASDWKYQSWRR